MKTPQRILVISDRYLPEIGGSITWLHNVYSRAEPGTVYAVSESGRISTHHAGIALSSPAGALLAP